MYIIFTKNWHLGLMWHRPLPIISNDTFSIKVRQKSNGSHHLFPQTLLGFLIWEQTPEGNTFFINALYIRQCFNFKVFYCNEDGIYCCWIYLAERRRQQSLDWTLPRKTEKKEFYKTDSLPTSVFKQFAEYCHLQALILLSKAITFNRDNITMYSSPFVVQYLTQYSLGASLNNCLNWIQPAGHNLLFVNCQKSKYVFVDFNLFYDEIQSRNSCRVPQKRLHRNFLENFLVLRRYSWWQQMHHC